MIQDLLIPTYEEDYDDIPYDLIYNPRTKIPTKKELTCTNNTPKTCSNETSLCMNIFYNSSKYFFLFLFLILSSTVGILYLIIFMDKNIN